MNEGVGGWSDIQSKSKLRLCVMGSTTDWDERVKQTWKTEI